MEQWTLDAGGVLNTKYAIQKKERQPRHQLHHMFTKYTIQNIKYSSKLVYAILSLSNFRRKSMHFLAYNLQV